MGRRKTNYPPAATFSHCDTEETKIWVVCDVRMNGTKFDSAIEKGAGLSLEERCEIQEKISNITYEVSEVDPKIWKKYYDSPTGTAKDSSSVYDNWLKETCEDLHNCAVDRFKRATDGSMTIGGYPLEVIMCLPVGNLKLNGTTASSVVERHKEVARAKARAEGGLTSNEDSSHYIDSSVVKSESASRDD